MNEAQEWIPLTSFVRYITNISLKYYMGGTELFNSLTTIEAGLFPQDVLEKLAKYAVARKAALRPGEVELRPRIRENLIKQFGLENVLTQANINKFAALAPKK